MTSDATVFHTQGQGTGFDGCSPGRPSSVRSTFIRFKTLASFVTFLGPPL